MGVKGIYLLLEVGIISIQYNEIDIEIRSHKFTSPYYTVHWISTFSVVNNRVSIGWFELVLGTPPPLDKSEVDKK